MTRFLSYNVAGCEHRKHRFQQGMKSLLDDIRFLDADLIAFQEVHDETHSDTGFLSRLRALGYDTILFGPTLRRADSNFGNLVVARGQAKQIRELNLSVDGKEPRGAIGLSWSHEGRPFEVFATHLGLSRSERTAQLQRLDDWIKETPRENEVTRIVMGDFNEWNRFSKVNRMMDKSFGTAPRIASFSSVFPVLALDRIFVQSGHEDSLSWKVHRGRGRFDSSDHLPLTLDVDG